MSVRVALEDPGVDASLDAAHDERPHRSAGSESGRDGIEVAEGPREHHTGQLRFLVHEGAVGEPERLQVGHRVLALSGRRELPSQDAEALEEHLPHESGPVAEQLVDRGGGRLGSARDAARGETAGPLPREHLDRCVGEPLLQLWRPQLPARHLGRAYRDDVTK